ncbi:MAG: exodeoxyribonuclease V subunit alpha [Proteobacteria bacterium]|nr:exodeoxyribonuclease V subunit alpha [Pseudomonadota bacterium]
MVNEGTVDHLHQEGLLSPLDTHFAAFMERLAGKRSPELRLAAALVSARTREGHICLDLPGLQGKPLLETGEKGGGSISLPWEDWGGILRESGVIGTAHEYKPLILDDRGRLYLYRYWEYERKLADLINLRVLEEDPHVNMPLLKQGLSRIFAPSDSEEVDWQKVAACTALLRKFTVISGGPGTGKTTTAAKIMALLLEQMEGLAPRIGLVSPTGKGAARLQWALKAAKESLDCHDSIKASIPDEASTIHRLLGSIPGTPYFRHHSKNLLPLDVLVVDEASMVDLALMSKLVQALPREARLILLGDKDQLASVEAGAVLGDICDRGRSHGFSEGLCRDLSRATGNEFKPEPHGPGIGDCIVQLRKSYRFSGESGIALLSRAVNEGDGDLALAYLREGGYPDVRWRALPSPDALPRAMNEKITQGFREAMKANDPRAVFDHFEQFRILCALRTGPYGVGAFNAMVERALREEGLISPEGRWYKGRPILITRNDHNLRLYNGDVGIVLPHPEADGELRALFPGPDDALRAFHFLRLPEHETVYAMTVHKSQGSEFNRVLLILPDRDSPVLTRELIYTGITRARGSVEIWGSAGVFKGAVARRTVRTSGLRDALWEA